MLGLDWRRAAALESPTIRPGLGDAQAHRTGAAGDPSEPSRRVTRRSAPGRVLPHTSTGHHRHHRRVGSTRLRSQAPAAQLTNRWIGKGLVRI